GPHRPSGRAVVSSAPRAFTPIFARRQRLRLSPCLPARTARTRGARSANARPGLGIVLASACDAAQRADSHEGDYSLDSIIASAILSGVGPVCPECLSRGARTRLAPAAGGGLFIRSHRSSGSARLGHPCRSRA